MYTGIEGLQNLLTIGKIRARGQIDFSGHNKVDAMTAEKTSTTNVEDNEDGYVSEFGKLANNG